MEAIRAVFFDARDTLGEVDRPGHLVAYRPSTEKLLRSMKDLGLWLGCITNLPDNVWTQVLHRKSTQPNLSYELRPNAKGELRGALLVDGSMVRLDAREASHFAEWLRPRAALAARGEGVETKHGRIVTAKEIGPSPQDLRSARGARGEKHEKKKRKCSQS